ncbi:MAG: hypothetical protein A3C70_00075 [Candidatus Zambryskibacteria bacterium RIFCSPHIGHO2_02_FULL_43_14]|uniref:PKD domain-containing protein n=1 Tax=Candidatus Zambryskibacteria bacterium RIFCSPHIGHO2_02_FULL_43_14 TaxID=1802748 RepID=A0A1G2TFL7_9BACT|nr:MAG: hypothetical protein A2829_03125 [Candidatus Zambryskibacteria bacterium RIFCSPHIGHO2_01_FULL_43_60]OHA95848.1 MAG: hypothetical protein A3C70_00075 [Candidatus Zambryskibacteria bacterium RIFCSPHIGHO2_02_FULL_43_14]OHB03384.1 MAG: hypothetical protein A3B03_02255 [Candidatus Zambryskibacteria bacterium RIFCSPLOWO2_01_FULL_42_41]
MKHLLKIILVVICVIGVYAMPTDAEATTKQVFYSVGQNTNDHKTGTPLNISIANGVATFSVAQTAANMGVGDRVTYKGNQKVFISGKISQTQWNVVTVNGDIPPDATDEIVNSIRHEFDSLDNAMSIYKGNQSSDANHLGTLDLVAGNYILNIPLYYDTGPEYFNGGGIYAGILINYFNTGPNNYIKIYTPTNTTSEVNSSQRHDGKWNDQKYSLIFSPDNNSTAAIRTYIPYVKVDGLQIKIISSNDDNKGIEASYIASGWVEFSNNIITGQILNFVTGIHVGYTNTYVLAKIWNNLVYDLRGTNYGSSFGIIYGSVSGVVYLYNNTVINIPYGISNHSSEANIVAKNNIVQDASSGYDGAGYRGNFDLSSSNNISNQNDAPGSNPQNNTTVSFVNKAGKDFHLSPSDTKALDKGINLISDPNIPISSDFEGNSRPSGVAWDIGADELFAAQGNIVISATLDGEPWPISGNDTVAYTLSGPSGDISNSFVPFTYNNVTADESYTLAYFSGGPAGAILHSISPILPVSSQFLPSGTSISFNLNFVSGSNLCPLTPQSKRTIISFEPYQEISSPALAPHMGGPFLFSTPLPAGEYDITLVSYDHHMGAGGSGYQHQPNEKFYLKLLDQDSDIIVSTDSTPDISDDQDYVTALVNTNLQIANDVYSTEMWHGAYIDNSDYNGLYPICAAFDESFDYSLSDSGTSNVIKTDSDTFAQNTITKTLVSGAARNISLSVSGAPPGVTTSISGQDCNLTCTSVITFTVSPSTNVGTYPIIVTGYPLDKSTEFDLVVLGDPLIVSCVASPTTVFLGETVTLTADVSGGVTPYIYSWAGTDIPTGPSPDTNPFSISYNTIGQKSVSVTVTDSSSPPFQTTCPEITVRANIDPQYEEF